MYYLQLVQLESWVYLYHSWFSLDGVSDFGVVTLACDDGKRIQAHEVYPFVRWFSEAGPADSGQVTLAFDDCKPNQAHRSWVGNLFKVLVLLYSV